MSRQLLFFIRLERERISLGKAAGHTPSFKMVMNFRMQAVGRFAKFEKSGFLVLTK
jgi:hypothetical protein